MFLCINYFELCIICSDSISFGLALHFQTKSCFLVRFCMFQSFSKHEFSILTLYKSNISQSENDIFVTFTESFIVICYSSSNLKVTVIIFVPQTLALIRA